MGKTKGRPQRGKLVSMAIVPPPDEPYEPPPPDECEEFTERILLMRGCRLSIRRVFRIGQNTVVEFGVNQVVRIDGDWVDVARIDTAHGTVHRHDFTKDGGNHITTLEVIPSRGGEDVVDRWCVTAEKMMQNEWQENLGRWHGDDQ